MWLEAKFEIKMPNEKNGIDVRKRTNVGAWNQRDSMIIEPPFRMEGGVI